jgi:hypothetical protein
MNLVKRSIRVLLNRSEELRLPPEATDKEYEIVERCKPFTMSSNARLWATISASKYIIKNSIEGAFVECGVWRSGSSMAMALSLLDLNTENRNLFLFDTFSGMTEPSDNDVDGRGVRAKEILDRTPKGNGNNIWCVAGLEDVKANMASTNYPKELIRYIEGDIVETLKDANNLPDKIALLRLDTDWFDSTKVELEVLYPRLVKGGICIIDDYGHWYGARKAVTEYFDKQGFYPFLQVTDYTGRLFIKTDV